LGTKSREFGGETVVGTQNGLGAYTESEPYAGDGVCAVSWAGVSYVGTAQGKKEMESRPVGVAGPCIWTGSLYGFVLFSKAGVVRRSGFAHLPELHEPLLTRQKVV